MLRPCNRNCGVVSKGLIDVKDCERFAPKIHLLAEGGLEAHEAESLKKHLDTCPKCAKLLEESRQLRTLIETSLSAKLPFRDDTEEIMRRATQAGLLRPPRKRWKVFLKRGLIAVAAFLAVVVIGAYTFAHIYFRKTFSGQLEQMVIRCSQGIEKKIADASWEPLRVGDRFKAAPTIRTPAGKRSFLSFDGIRLMADSKAEFHMQGRRAFSITAGEAFVATAESTLPLNITVGNISLQTNNGVLHVARSGETASLGVISGSADLSTHDGRTWSLTTNQTATFERGEGSIQSAAPGLRNPFAQMKTSVIERIRQRFARILSERLPQYLSLQMDIRGQLKTNLLGMFTRPEGMYQFASFVHRAGFKLAQTRADALGDYYESLFVPSNRSILIGRQKLVRVRPSSRTSFPTWSHDGSMIAYAEQINPNWWPTVVKVARLDDLDNPWVISQEYETMLPMFPLAWAPDDRHVLFMVTENLRVRPDGWTWDAPYKIKIAPIDPAEGPVRDFNSPFHDIPLKLPLPVGKTLSPQILKLPWGDAVLCANWGNIGYIPIEPDGQAVPGAPGLFLTNFNPRELFVAGGTWSYSGNKIVFMAIENLKVNPVNVYILYDVEDILDGFAPPPRSPHDPRIKKVSPGKGCQVAGGFSFDESLVFYQEDMNQTWHSEFPTLYWGSDFDLFYADALEGAPARPTQIQLPGSQVFLRVSPEGNRLAYCNYEFGDTPAEHRYEMSVVSFDIEADIDADLGGVLIDNSGTNLILPPGVLENNLKVRISTPLSIRDEAEILEGETPLLAMRLIDAGGLEHPKFIEPMTLTIRYTDDEVAGLDESMLEIYYCDETDPEHPVWVPLGGTVDPDHNEITVEIRHFSKFSVGASARDK